MEVTDDRITGNWVDTKHLTLVNLAPALTSICFGASFVLLQLSDMYHEANPKTKKVYSMKQWKFYIFGGGNVEESIVYGLQMFETKIFASIGFICFSLLNILSTIFILTHVTAELRQQNFGLYYIVLRLLVYYLLALISWWGDEGPQHFFTAFPTSSSC